MTTSAPVNSITDIDLPNESQAPITRPPSTTTEAPPATTTSSNYTLAPGSVYACQQPGFYSEPSNCREFYMCKEVSTGVLSAERVFRCPDRYLFDPVTNLCQRAQKVSCVGGSSLFYSFRDLLVIQLAENQLNQFFNQPLTLPEPGLVESRTALAHQPTNQLSALPFHHATAAGNLSPYVLHRRVLPGILNPHHHRRPQYHQSIRPLTYFNPAARRSPARISTPSRYRGVHGTQQRISNVFPYFHLKPHFTY